VKRQGDQLAINTTRRIVPARAGVVRIMGISTTENAARFAFALANVSDPITNFNFRNKRVNFVVSATEKDIFKQNLSCKFQTYNA